MLFNLNFLNADPDVSELKNFVVIKVHLGELFDRWLEAGALGTYYDINYETQTVSFNGQDPILLEGILFDKEEQQWIEISFEILPDVDGTQMNDEWIHFRQLDQEGKVYGNYSYELVYEGFGGSSGERTRIPGLSNLSPVNGVKVFPNPATSNVQFEFPSSNQVSIKLSDITGRVVVTENQGNTSSASLSVKTLPRGIYFYNITFDNTVSTGKIVLE